MSWVTGMQTLAKNTWILFPFLNGHHCHIMQQRWLKSIGFILFLIWRSLVALTCNDPKDVKNKRKDRSPWTFQFHMTAISFQLHLHLQLQNITLFLPKREPLSFSSIERRIIVCRSRNWDIWTRPFLFLVARPLVLSSESALTSLHLSAIWPLMLLWARLFQHTASDTLMLHLEIF